MPARTGAQFLARLADARTHVEIGGETLRGGVESHPAFRNVVRSYAELYDMQHDPRFAGVLTHPSPLTGEPVGTSFLAPRSPDDLVKRGRRSGPGRISRWGCWAGPGTTSTAP